ncbi:MAG: sensor histidine kinase [Pseudobdellovibrionaceae bacterium]
MPDEIENLVIDLQDTDRARTQLLQELAHDLRTPIASLKSLLETLDSKRTKLDEATQSEITTLALKEVDYFARLVEDLLFLAQIKGPTFSKNSSFVNVVDLLLDEADDSIVRSRNQGKVVTIRHELEQREFALRCDPYLIRRLLRNALENAFSFAKSEVTLKIESADKTSIRIAIQDDGGGFSEEALNAFGTRRATRKFENHQSGRLSVGLGSVVMKTICEAHQGKIEVSNIASQGTVTGANVEIILSL